MMLPGVLARARVCLCVCGKGVGGSLEHETEAPMSDVLPFLLIAAEATEANCQR